MHHASSETSKGMPAWKVHFPLAWADDHFITRREFTKSMMLISFATFAANAVLSVLSMKHFARSKKPGGPAKKIAQHRALAVGQSLVFHYPDKKTPCILIRLARDRYKAFRQHCTHLGCPVIYHHGRKQMICPCHRGFFNPENGNVLSGPPPRGLREVSLRIDAEGIWVTGFKA